MLSRVERAHSCVFIMFSLQSLSFFYPPPFFLSLFFSFFPFAKPFFGLIMSELLLCTEWCSPSGRQGAAVPV